jgi:hypothetical protein
MSTRLINVRLDAERVRKARALRAQGVTLSDVVREAIDARYEKLEESARGRDARAIVKRILARFPDPPDLPVRDYDVHDRRVARGAIRERLRKRQ